MAIAMPNKRQLLAEGLGQNEPVKSVFVCLLVLVVIEGDRIQTCILGQHPAVHDTMQEHENVYDAERVPSTIIV